MISIDDALRMTEDELERVCVILLDRYRIQLEGERDPDAERKVRDYREQLTEFCAVKVAEFEHELEVFGRAHRVLN